MLNIQIYALGNGKVGVALHDCPVEMARLETGDVAPVPAFAMSAEEAMQVGMNLIHMAKLVQG